MSYTHQHHNVTYDLDRVGVHRDSGWQHYRLKVQRDSTVFRRSISKVEQLIIKPLLEFQNLVGAEL